ncbi:MAG TPA: CHAT domain-containing protein [Candidatus Angelobacter sp.]|jgi:CHAT domain-containing protein
MKSFSKRFGFHLIVLLLLISSLVLIWGIKPRTTNTHVEVRTGDPIALLSEANRLSWLGNWYAAGPLYQQAELRFHAIGDTENEAYARIGRIRAQAVNVPLDRTLSLFSNELEATTMNPKARLWCLALKGYLEINSDSNSTKRDWTEALQIANALGESQWAARATGELGVISFLEGNTASAVSLVGKAILSAYRTGDTASQVRLLSMLGNGFNEERRFSEALMMFQRGIAIAEGTPDAGFPFMAYGGEAAALTGLHQTARAKELMERALTAARYQENRANEADLLVQMGEVALADDKIDDAKSYFTQAGQIAGGLRLYRTLSYAMFDLANVERQLGDTQGASDALKVGLSASRHVGDRYYVPRDLTALAEIAAGKGNFRQADRLFEQAEDVLDGILINQHSFEESTARAGSMSSTYLEHFRLALQMGDVGRAFQVLERVRGRTVASHLYTQQKTDDNSPRLVSLEAKIAATQLALMRTDDAEERSGLLEQLLAEERNRAFELNEAGLQRRDVLTKPAPLKTIQAMLGDNEVLAEYVLGEPKAFCVVITKQSAQLVTLPAGANRIQTLTASYLSELKSRKSGEQVAGELYTMLLEPVLRSFHQARLIVSPDGILYSLPFEALRDRDGFVVRSKIVSYTPSASVLWRLRAAHVAESHRPLLAIGAVDYKMVRALPKSVEHGSVAAVIVRGIAQLSGSRLEDLPASRDEVLAIAQIAGPDAELLLGQKATESAFKNQALADYRVIHLATHAAADPQYPDRAALVLGIAPNTSDDGLLQVREIMRLSLNAELVTLSACDTNVGAAAGEAGVVNLEQAFLIAGARAVVASLWNVEDNSTTVMMKAFYTHLAEHEDKALALAHAKRDILERYGDTSPYYWAAFVMVGEGAQPVSFGR